MDEFEDNSLKEDEIEDGSEPLTIGDKLLDRGAVSDDQLRIALYEQQETNEPLGRVLVRLGFVTEATIRDVLSESGGSKVVDLRRVTVASEVLSLIPIDVAQRYTVFPIAYDDENRVLSLAVANPNDILMADQIRAFLGGEYDLEFFVAEESEISRMVNEYYGLELTIEGILSEIERGVDFSSDASNVEVVGSTDEESSLNPIVRLVGAFLNDGVKRGASDIHFEPEESFLRVRYRIDGVLRQIRSLHRSYWDGMAVRIKVISGMNIAESRLPQDGRISFTLYGRVVDFRVSSQPVTHGENFVLRILDQQRNVSKIDNLGLGEKARSLLLAIIERPTGVTFVTGPTGSGKTTTLYSIVQHLNKESINIMTLEDPVEYPLPMIRQSYAGESSKMDWAAGIKSILRQDPDIILVGEVRDSETSSLVFRAAMTGHLVLATLHTNSALGVIPRILDLGVLPSIMATNMSGVIAQRLIRRLCPSCKKKKEGLSELEKNVFSHFRLDVEKIEIHEPVGCSACDMQGYRGRLAIMEILRFNDVLDEAVSNSRSLSQLRQIAGESGVFVSMAGEAMNKVAEGLSTLEEVRRVVDLTDYFYPIGAKN